MRKLVVSFGSGEKRERNAQFATITRVKHMTWDEVVALFKRTPLASEDKSAAGWYAFAEFSEMHRDSEYFVARHALTMDYDRITVADVATIRKAFTDLEYIMYTTASHTPDAPRLRVILPLSRPAGYDEFQAVSRKIAERAGIELASRETHVPAQMMYLPTQKATAEYKCGHHPGARVDVDAVLAEYEDWTDRQSWPKRKDHDGVHSDVEQQTAPTEKPGIVGDFCRAFDIPTAIERFGLPYVPAGSAGRYTYTQGSVAEGAVVYDNGAKLHSHHDTDPARGQTNSFDLVRLHRFARLDEDHDGASITERPSYKAMCRFALEQPEVRDAQCDASFDDLGPLTDEEQLPADRTKGGEALAKRICDVLRTRTAPRWLIKDYIERAVIALLVGKRGSYKSFIALDWTGRIAQALDTTTREAVLVVSAEGGDYDRRAKAWWNKFGDGRDIESVPWYVIEKRMNLATREGIDMLRGECVRLNIRPVLFVLDTFSKLSGGLDENDNSAVKGFIGMLDNGLKRAFDATVLLVAHTGHGDQSRARGASALGADTDSEFIVSRDERTGAVALTRERFKSSPELPPVNYAPEVVELDYHGDDGKPITSLVMNQVADIDKPAAREPRGQAQRRVWEILQEMCAGGAEVRVSAVAQRVVESQSAPEEGKRDRRRELAGKALDGLVSEGFAYYAAEGTRVSISRAKAVAEEQFDEDDDLGLGV